MSDSISLTLPRSRPFYRIAHLVLGGLAVRLDLTFEKLEDLQVALAGLLDQDDDADEVTLVVRIDQDELTATVGPFHAGLRERLDAGEGEMTLGRVLGTVVDSVAVDAREGGDWVELRKDVRAAAA